MLGDRNRTRGGRIFRASPSAVAPSPMSSRRTRDRGVSAGRREQAEILLAVWMNGHERSAHRSSDQDFCLAKPVAKWEKTVEWLKPIVATGHEVSHILYHGVPAPNIDSLSGHAGVIPSHTYKPDQFNARCARETLGAASR
jgi:hypothetical protein